MQDTFNQHPDDHEAKMARADLFKCAQYSFKLFKMIHEDMELEGWVQAKITKAADYIASVFHYMEYEMKISEYGDNLENADMYSESIRRVFEQKLMEAKTKAAKVKAMESKCSGCGKPMPKCSCDDKIDEERSSTGGEITKTKTGLRHAHNPNRFSDEPHAEPASKVKSKSAAEKASDRAMDKADEKDSKAFGKANPGKQTIMKGGVKTTNEGVTDHKPCPPMSHVKKMCQDGKSVAEICKMHPDCDQKELKQMVADCKKKLSESAKPDFLDMDKDGNKKETMKKAVADKKAGPKKGVNPFAKVKEGMAPMDPDGATAPPPKGKDGQYPIVTSGPHKGKRWSPKTPGPTNAAFKEAAAKCNHSPKGKSCPVHGLKECSGMYEGDKFDPLKHVKNPTQGEKDAAKDVKRGSYADRAAMLKSAEADGRLKK